MKLNTTVQLLTIACLITVMCGCQTGKFNMPNLAFWKKNDTLGSEYIEPPSHQFTPSESAIVKSDDENLPPLPPDIDKTLDSFEREVSRSYQELARQTEESRDQFANHVKQVEVDTRNVAIPPSRKIGASEFASPLTPKTGNRIAQNPTPRTGGFAPPQNAPTNGTSENNTPGFNPGLTQYEKIAQQSSQPESVNPLTPRAILPSDANPEVAINTNGQIKNPYSGSSGFKPAPVATPRPPVDTMQADNVQVGYEYPATPYKPYQPRTVPANSTNPSSDEAPKVANRPMTLQLQGQGSYAPGSVRIPSPLDPNNLKLPMRTNSTSSTSGGSFQP